MSRIAALALALLLSCAASADAQDSAAQREISHLLDYLAASGCQFNRNGTWYDSAQAVSHLKRKYDYLLNRGLVADADAFIDRAAAQSSSSGKPYLVQCDQAPAVKSAEWLREELARYRASERKQ